MKEKIKEEDYLCNKCGNTCIRYHTEGLPEKYGLINAQFEGGYLSDPLEDCTIYTFSLCEVCLYDLFCSFKIKVNKQDYSEFLPEQNYEKYYIDQ